MGLKVCKFGGTSMASGSTILEVAKIVNADKERRYVIVSAPGKRFSGDIKITDLPYACSDAVEAGNEAEFRKVFDKIRVRFLNIQTEIGKDLGLAAALSEVEENMLNGAGRDYAASRGEFFAAKIMAAVLGVPFVDATEFVRFDEYGVLKQEETFALGEKVLSAYPRAVIPGFYGLGENAPTLFPL